MLSTFDCVVFIINVTRRGENIPDKNYRQSYYYYRLFTNNNYYYYCCYYHYNRRSTETTVRRTNNPAENRIYDGD